MRQKIKITSIKRLHKADGLDAIFRFKPVSKAVRILFELTQKRGIKATLGKFNNNDEKAVVILEGNCEAVNIVLMEFSSETKKHFSWKRCLF